MDFIFLLNVDIEIFSCVKYVVTFLSSCNSLLVSQIERYSAMQITTKRVRS